MTQTLYPPFPVSGSPRQTRVGRRPSLGGQVILFPDRSGDVQRDRARAARAERDSPTAAWAGVLRRLSKDTAPVPVLRLHRRQLSRGDVIR